MVGDLVPAAECVIMYILINALYTANAEESRWVCTSLNHNKLQSNSIPLMERNVNTQTALTLPGPIPLQKGVGPGNEASCG